MTFVLLYVNFRLFITHYGGCGAMEAIWNRVPMIGSPIDMDQVPSIAFCEKA